MREKHLRWNSFILNMWNRKINFLLNNPLCRCDATSNNPLPSENCGYKLRMHINNKVRL